MLTYSSIFRRLPCTKLREITLVSLEMEMLELVHLLLPNKMLKNVSLAYCTMTAGHWIEFLKRIKGRLPQLASLALWELSTDGDEASLFLEKEPSHSHRWEFKEDDPHPLMYVCGKMEELPYFESHRCDFAALRMTSREREDYDNEW